MASIDLDTLAPFIEEGYITCRPHPTAALYIFNYTQKTQWERNWTPETKMCRGLITDLEGNIVARPFLKFMNYGEDPNQEIPNEPFIATMKMDGSLGILYQVDGIPYIATRGSFTSEQAQYATRLLHEKYGDFEFDPGLTYLVEIIYPGNRIVVDYGEMEDLVLLALIDTHGGNEIDIHNPFWAGNWPFPVVKHYDGLTDLEAIQQIQEENEEGFVIRFESGLRLKIKMADYIRLHRLITQVNARVIWDLLRNNQSFDELLERVPDEFYQWVQNTRTGLLAHFSEIEQESQRIYAWVKDLPTRKEQAALVTKTPYAAVVFRMLDGKDYAEMIWKQLRPVAERPFREENEG